MTGVSGYKAPGARLGAQRLCRVDFRPYTILGACNSKRALEALSIEDKAGTMGR